MVKASNIAKSTIQITIFSIFSLFLSFISQLVIAYFYGTSTQRDAYFAAIVIPTYVTAVITGSFGYIFLTKVVEAQKLGDQESLDRFLSSTIVYLTSFLLIITILISAFSKNIINFTAAGLSPEQKYLASKILLILAPTLIFSIFTNFLSSIYQINQKFLTPAFVPILVPISSILFIYLFNKYWGIISIAIGTFVGTVSGFVILTKAKKILNFKFSFDLKLSTRSSIFNSFLKISIPLFLTGIIFRSTTVIERFIASNLEAGSISYLGYGNQILTILSTMTSAGIATSIFPLITKYWNEDNIDAVNSLLLKSIRIIFIIAFPTMLAMFFWSELFIKIIFERGAFTHYSTISVSNVIVFLMGAFLFQNLGSVLIKLFYISQRTWAISFIALIELIVYFLLGFYLAKQFSYKGLALALSVSSFINIVCSVLYIKLEIVNIMIKSILIDGIKVLIISVISIGLMKILFNINLFHAIELTNFILCSLVGALTFYICGQLFKIEEFVLVRAFIKQKKCMRNHN